MCSPVKKTFVHFFFKSHEFSDGYQPVVGDKIPIDPGFPPLEIKSRNFSELECEIPDKAVGCVYFDVITAQIENCGRMVELTSGEINRSGRHFFQGKDHGRLVTRTEAKEEYDKHTSMRRYCRLPIPEKIVLFPGGCTFDFLEIDTLVPVHWNFMRQGYIPKTAEKAA